MSRFLKRVNRTPVAVELLIEALEMHDAMPPVDTLLPASTSSVDPSVPYAEARRRALDAFERDYVAALVDRHAGKISRAAEAAEMDRVYLHRLMRRHRSGGRE